MGAEDVSAVGSIAAAMIALVALVVAIYAAVVARRSAVSAERSAEASEVQAEVARRSYRLAAQPGIDLDLSVTMRQSGHAPKGMKYVVRLSRTAGPFAVEVQFMHGSAVTHRDRYGVTRPTVLHRVRSFDVVTEDDQGHWLRVPRWKLLAGNDHHEMFGFFKNENDLPVHMLNVRVEYRVREQSSTDPDTWWSSTEFLEWTNPEWDPHQSAP